MTTLATHPTASRNPGSRSSRSFDWQIRPHVIGAVFNRNFQAYFSNPAGLRVHHVVCSGRGLCRVLAPEFFANNLANLGTLNQWMPYLLLFFIPAITMSAWAEERRQGTDELLSDPARA